eukprot:UN29731
MATHYSVFHSAWWNVTLGYILGVFHHIPTTWIRQHNTGHHVYTNTKYDPDGYHFQTVGYRLLKEQPWREKYAFWRRKFFSVVPFSGCAPAVSQTFKLLSCALKGKPIKLTSDGPVIMTNLPTYEAVVAWSQYIFYMYILWSPFYYHGIISTVIPWALHGSMFYLVSQISHNNESSSFKKQSEWCLSQMQTSSGDYENGGSKVWLFFSVGLNYQAIHHIFPNIHWAHYPALAPMVYETIGQDMPTQTIWDCMKDLYQYIGSLNDINGVNEKDIDTAGAGKPAKKSLLGSLISTMSVTGKL